MPARVLVVDDDPLVCDLVAAVLTEGGYAAVTASSGSEALERLIVQPPDLILLDLLMPEMSGTEFYAVLSRAGFAIPVVIVSAIPPAAADPVVQQAAGYVRKPFDLAVLLQAVEQVLPPTPTVGTARAGWVTWLGPPVRDRADDRPASGAV